MNIFKTPYIVEKNIEIDSTIENVWECLTTFSKKLERSPRYRLENDCKSTTSGDILQEGFVEEWEGRIIGKGSETIGKIEKNKYIEGKLKFLKPFKGEAINKIFITEVGGKIHVKWVMESSISILLFFMKPMIKSMLSMDFERGLIMLKSLAETGEINSVSESIGSQRFKGGHYIGIRRVCDAASMPKQMEQDFKDLIQFFGERGYPIEKESYTIYNKCDLIKGTFDYTSCLPVNLEIYNSVNLDKTIFITGESPSFASHAIRHTGSYNFLGNAWNYAYSYPKAYNIGVSYKKAPVEVYITNPNITEDKNNITDIYVPLR